MRRKASCRHCAIAPTIAATLAAIVNCEAMAHRQQSAHRDRAAVAGRDLYLVRTTAASVGDFGQVVALAGSFVPGALRSPTGNCCRSMVPGAVPANGSTYGGNGTTDFALPNLSGRTVFGTGLGARLTNRTLGSVAGSTAQTH